MSALAMRWVAGSAVLQQWEIEVTGLVAPARSAVSLLLTTRRALRSAKVMMIRSRAARRLLPWLGVHLYELAIVTSSRHFLHLHCCTTSGIDAPGALHACHSLNTSYLYLGACHAFR
jgi:hypothetical protein